MPENKPFVINDRRKFTSEGELRPDAPQSQPREESPRPEAAVDAREHNPADSGGKGPQLVPESPADSAAGFGNGLQSSTPEGASEPGEPSLSEQFPPPPTAEQNAQATRAYDATVDRLDTAIRATNPGMERLPDMSFERFVQSLYMQALMQLGGASDPGQTPQVDLLGARQTIDMLSIMAEKTRGNLTDPEDKLVQSALFELRMGFLEITQALARSAGSKGGAPGVGPGFGAGSGPSIVR